MSAKTVDEIGAPEIRPHYHHAPFCQREDGSFVYRACCCSGKWLDIPTSNVTPLRRTR